MPVPLCLLSEETVWATRGSRTCNLAPFPRPRNWGSEKSDSTQSTPELVQHVQGPSVPALELLGTIQHGSSLLSFPRVETWGPWWWGDRVRTRIWGSDSQTKTLFMALCQSFGEYAREKHQIRLSLVTPSFLSCLLSPTKLQAPLWVTTPRENYRGKQFTARSLLCDLSEAKDQLIAGFIWWMQKRDSSP